MLLVALKTEQLDVEIETQLLTTQFFEEKEYRRWKETRIHI